MADPHSTSPGSIMPAYNWMLTRDVDYASIPARIRALQTLGVPYDPDFDKVAIDHMKLQAEGIANRLIKDGFKQVDGMEITSDRQIIAMIAYLQRLGTDIKGEYNPWANLPDTETLLNARNTAEVQNADAVQKEGK
jgi:cytochrome c oxidase cbb3-type subunit I/II